MAGWRGVDVDLRLRGVKLQLLLLLLLRLCLLDLKGLHQIGRRVPIIPIVCTARIDIIIIRLLRRQDLSRQTLVEGWIAARIIITCRYSKLIPTKAMLVLLERGIVQILLLLLCILMITPRIIIGVVRGGEKLILWLLRLLLLLVEEQVV